MRKRFGLVGGVPPTFHFLGDMETTRWVAAREIYLQGFFAAMSTVRHSFAIYKGNSLLNASELIFSIASIEAFLTVDGHEIERSSKTIIDSLATLFISALA